MPLAHDTWLVEGIMTTLAPSTSGLTIEQRVNIAPMGPIVDRAMSQLLLRPFKSSTTYSNLKATRQGVFHITDDVLLLARAAIGCLSASDVPFRSAKHVDGVVLTGACRYYEVQVEDLDDRDDRTKINARVVGSGLIRDFLGFNRAKHAVIEAAILATRLRWNEPATVLAKYDRWQEIVEKTGSACEHESMRLLRSHVVKACEAAAPDGSEQR